MWIQVRSGVHFKYTHRALTSLGGRALLIMRRALNTALSYEARTHRSSRMRALIMRRALNTAAPQYHALSRKRALTSHNEPL
jgi:hypothetical protein